MRAILNPFTGKLQLAPSAASEVGLAGLATNITAGKTLTLTATDDYTLTIPATGTAALLATANVFTESQTVLKTTGTLLTLEASQNTDVNFVVKNSLRTFAFSQRSSAYTRPLVAQFNCSSGQDFEIINSNALPIIYCASSTRRVAIGFPLTNTVVTVPVTLYPVTSTTTVNEVAENTRLMSVVSTASTGASNGFGVGLTMYAETATDGTYQQQAQIASAWVDATNATRKAKLQLSAYDTAEKFGASFSADGTSTNAISILGAGDGKITLSAPSDVTLTVPATGTAALLATANVFTTQQMVDGASDQIQLRVQAHSTQTANLQTWEDSSGIGILGYVSGVGYGRFTRVGIAKDPSVQLDVAGQAYFSVNVGAYSPTALPNFMLKTENPTAQLNGVAGVNLQATPFSGGASVAFIGIVAEGATLSPIVFMQRIAGGYHETMRLTATGDLKINKPHTTTTTVSEAARLQVFNPTASTGGGTGYGVGQSFYAETATDGTYQQLAQIAASWVDATNATRKAKLQLSAYDTAIRTGLEIEATGAGVFVNIKGGQIRPYVAKTADYTITTNDYVVDVTANSVNITLPTAAGVTGQIFQINNSGTGLVTILTTSSQTVNGDASGVVQLAQWEQLTVMSNGSNWIVIY